MRYFKLLFQSIALYAPELDSQPAPGHHILVEKRSDRKSEAEVYQSAQNNHIHTLSLKETEC